MKQTDKAEFAKIVLAFAELKGKALSLPAVELYWVAMQGWSLEDFKAAATRLLQTAQFMPTPFDFNQLRLAGRLTAGEAWSQAVEWVRAGTYTAPAKTQNAVFIDRVVQAMGGWQVIAQCAEDKLTFLEKRFAEHYQDMLAATDTREALPQIALTDNAGPALLNLTRRLAERKALA